MKIKGNVFVKALKTSVIVLVFMVCSNMNATTTTSKVVSLSVEAVTATTHFASIQAPSLFFGYKYKKPKYRKPNCKPRKPRKPKCKPKNPSKRKRKCPKVPLDGGLSFLLVGAAALGVKKLRDKKK